MGVDKIGVIVASQIACCISTRNNVKGDTIMKRRIFAACMAMCTMAMVVFTGTTGTAVDVYAAADVTDSTIYAESDGVTDSTIYTVPDDMTNPAVYTATNDETDPVTGTATEETADVAAVDYTQALDRTLSYLRKMADDPQYEAEWNVMTLARCGYEDEAWYGEYYDNIVKYVQSCVEETGSLKLDKKQYKGTDNSRVILALTAIGADATDVGGYNLLEPLADMNYVTKQGINGPVFALIAFDTAGYDIPKLPDGSDGVQTTREGLVEYILGRELSSGGWAFSGSNADPDMTGMTIQALAPYYKSNTEVKTAVDRALDVMSEQQKADGGFSSWGTVNSESCAQVICGLLDIGRDAGTDEAFVKNGHSVLDALMGFYVASAGGFAHDVKRNGELVVNGMASYQAGYALAAYDRFKKGRNTLYDMSDAKKPLFISVKLSTSTYVYDGKAKKPGVTVKIGDRVLKDGVDYTVSYQNNVNIGNSAKVVVTGKGIFKGSVSNTFVIKMAAPAKTSVSVSNGAVGVTVKWKKAARADRYVVLRKVGNAKNWTTVTTTKSLSYTDRKVANGKKYIYAVKSVGSGGEAAYTTQTIYRVNQEKITKIKSTVKKKCTVTYRKNASASGYRVMYSTDKTFKKNVKVYRASVNKKTNVTLSGLKAGKRYYVRVQGFKKVGKTYYYGAWSKTVNVVIRKK